MSHSLDYRATENERRLWNVVIVGTVESLDAAAARVRVRIGDLLTAPRPWLTGRAGADRTWWAPEPGEQVLLLCPGGEPELGVVLPGLYSDAHPAAASVATKARIDFADGGFCEYDRGAGTLKIHAVGPVTLEGGGLSAAKGVVQGDCLCVVTGKPHVMVSANVKGSL